MHEHASTINSNPMTRKKEMSMLSKSNRNGNTRNESGEIQWLRWVEARKSSKTSGLGRKSTAASDCSWRHAPRAYDSLWPLPPREGAASPRQRGSGRGGGGGRNRLSCRFTCDVHWNVWRF